MESSIATEWPASRLGSDTASGKYIAPWSRKSARDHCGWLAPSARTARILLETTDLPVTEVAYAAGFASIRQFNDTVREIYASTPSDLRRRSRHGSRGGAPTAGTIQLRLAHRRPADLAGVLAFLAARAVPGVEEVTHQTYRRSLVLPHGVGIVELTPLTVFWMPHCGSPTLATWPPQSLAAVGCSTSTPTVPLSTRCLQPTRPSRHSSRRHRAGASLVPWMVTNLPSGACWASRCR